MIDAGDELDPDTAALLADVADEYQARRARGEDPDPGQYAAQFPHAAIHIRRVLSVLHWTGPVAAHRSRIVESVANGTLGDFRIGREVGRGGMGVVYEAFQISLGRRVALKVLPFAALVDVRMLQRFQNEARAASALDHPHVVKVYAVGQERSVHFIAMQFIDGRPLSELIRDIHCDNRATGTPNISSSGQENDAVSSHDSTGPAAIRSTLPDIRSRAFFEWVAKLGTSAAEALEHAHALGIVHRDVKPANLLIDSHGALWVSDFGLAKMASSDAGVTMTGDVFGTLRYMSPEQALAKHDLVDHRTDIYGIGATIFELLAGRHVAEGNGKAEILRMITEAEPVSLRRLNRRVPVDLETVVLKCLRKEPNDRYASAKELADDLRRFGSGQPVLARPIGKVARTSRWLARRPWLVGMAAVAMLSVCAALSLGLWAAYQRAALATSRDKHDRVELERRAAEEDAQRQRFHALLERVRQRRGDPYAGWTVENVKALRQLADMPPARDWQHDLRTELAAALSAPDLVRTAVLTTDFPGGAMDYSGNGRLLAVCRWNELFIRLYNASTANDYRVLSIPADEYSRSWTARSKMADRFKTIRFSADSRWLVAGTTSGRLASWDLERPDVAPHVWAGHTESVHQEENEIYSVAFAADQQTFRSGTMYCIRKWSLDGTPAGSEITGYWLPASLPPLSGRVPVVRGEYVQLLDLGSGQVVPDTRYPGNYPIAVGPGSRLMAFTPRTWLGVPFLQAAGRDTVPRLLAADGPLEMRELNHLQFDPAGGLLVSTEGLDRRVKLWDVPAGRLVSEYTASGTPSRSAFTPDGRHVAVSGLHGIELFNVRNPVFDTVGVVAESSVASISASADHSFLTVVGDRPAVEYTWEAGANGMYRSLDEQVLGDGSPVPIADSAADGRSVLYVRQTGRRDILTVAGRGQTAGSSIVDARFGPDGRVWFIENHVLRCMGANHKSDTAVWQNDPDAADDGNNFRTIAVGRAGVFVGRRDGRLFRVAPETKGVTGWPLFEMPVSGIALSPDESRLLVGGGGGEVRLVDLFTGEAAVVADAHRAAVPGVAYGKHFFVTGSADRRVRLWRLDGQPIATLRMRGPVRKISLSNDERSLLVLVEGERAVRRWRLDLLFQEWRNLGLADGLPEL
jgi:serine/threonine protein kinase/WD40 repeat protein